MGRYHWLQFSGRGLLATVLRVHEDILILIEDQSVIWIALGCDSQSSVQYNDISHLQSVVASKNFRQRFTHNWHVAGFGSEYNEGLRQPVSARLTFRNDVSFVVAARENIRECLPDIDVIHKLPRDDAKRAMLQSTHQGVIFSILVSVRVYDPPGIEKPREILLDVDESSS